MPRPTATDLLASFAGWRSHFGVWAVVAGVAFVGLLIAAPARAPGSAVAISGLAPATSAPWLAVAPMLARFPLGDGATHVRLLSLLAGAVTVALLLWRATDERLVRRDQAGAAARTGDASEIRAETLALVFGALAIVLSRAFFQAATTPGPVAAGALLALGLLALAERALRTPSHARVGVGLALVAGVAAGGPMGAAAIGWPVALVVAVRALRRRARWLTSGAIACGVAILAALVVLARAPGDARFADVMGRWFLVPLLRSVVRLSPAAVASAASELADQVGVVALLVAAAGLVRLRATALVLTLWPLAAGLIVRAASPGDADGAVGLVVALVSLAVPIGAGIMRLSARLGRAALPAVVAIGVITVTWPLLAR